MDFEINKKLVLSTGHIQATTSKILDMEDDPQTEALAEILIWERSEFGYRIYVPLDDGPAYHMTVAALCPELAALMLLTHAQGCKWLVLDADGPKHEQLPAFDW